MRRDRYGWDERKIAKYRRTGRGTGSGSAYQPWLTVNDFASDGRSHRPWCDKTRRKHELFSDNEYYTFLDYWWDDGIIDIREQFPLPRLHTRAIALRRGYPHPVDRRTRVPLVQTTDLVLTERRADGLRLLAVSVKPASEILDQKVREKLDLERTYWQLQGVEWILVLDTDVKTRRGQNLDWLYGWESPFPAKFARRLERCEASLVERISVARDVPVRMTCAAWDSATDLGPGTGLSILCGMLRRKAVTTDLDSECIQDEPGSAFVLGGEGR